ncbi:thiol-disulfide isomerase/thioredoxin [Filimonas zeae]|uniref:Thioredoxin domain-containing protein n=1 Tax=Filimonas zeae TaxID=1737353 RepID=A0A917MTN5_9BACT|nr:TlpA disulfide reductase family protein [Filimonas zeae]MDR6339485.1 thiol-disulfide isomerase/thioredoxin [Filimonas zeae]GGH63399.1 hypothetical protein GCM10011379_14250 [Filimonas zeae]
MKKTVFTSVAALLALITHAQNKRGYENPIVTQLQSVTDTIQLQQQVDSLLAVADENNYLSVYQYYMQKKSAAKAEAVAAAAKQQWPQGRFAALEAAEVLQREKDPVKKAEGYEKAIREFGPNGFEFTAWDLAGEAAERGDKQKMLYYAGKMNQTSNTALYASLAYKLAAKDPAGALPLLKTAIDTIKTEVDALPAEPANAAAGSRGQRTRNNYWYYTAAYAQSLTRLGRATEAWQAVASLYDTAKNWQILGAAYVDAAIATRHYAEALPVAEKMITEGISTPEMQTKLKEAYTGAKGSAEGFDSYTATLTQKKASAFNEQILRQAINKPAKAFTLKDVNGNTVSLEALKGKVVVLDFWATWCGPCKASFPSMQMAQNKYKNDKDVQFLFIHTLDKGDGNPTAAAAKYVRDNKYDFQVLMDLRNKETGKSPVCDAYGITGIPTKFIIDKKGNIRFEVSGFGADSEKAVAEVAAMVEYARKNS